MDRLYEPLKYYNSRGKNEHLELTKKTFDDLLTRSKVNVEENRATVKAYDKERLTIEKIDKKISRSKTGKVFSIIGIVIASIATLYFLVNFSVPWLLVCIGAIVGLSILIAKKINPAIKNAQLLKEKHEEKARKLLGEANAQMAPLNALFEDDTPLRLIEKTLPGIDFDDKYTVESEKFFIDHHDFVDFIDNDSSMIDTLSGKFMGNPFLFCRSLVKTMGLHTYHGTLVISWTETYRDSNGRLRTRRRTQTLHASVSKPKPFYNTRTYLVYGSQAAPDLNFSRTYKHLDDLSEKALQRKIRKGEKKLKKKAQNALTKGESFQEMTNSEFDVLFGATDRDHEVQFRLMYTPLAQNNTVDLITDKVNFGDDFMFEKKKRFNVITSEHAQTWDMNTSASQYYSYSVDIAKEKFIKENTEFFKSVFFDFAPLMSVPAYLEEPCASMEEIKDYKYNYTYYEHEVMANALGEGRFADERSATRCILKTDFLSKSKEGDTVSVTANSYYTIPRVDFIPVLGGDGRMHPVPVHWLEYIPTSKTSVMKVNQFNKENQSQNLTSGAIYYHGMIAKALNE